MPAYKNYGGSAYTGSDYSPSFGGNNKSDSSVYVENTVAKILFDMGEGDGKSERVNGYLVKNSGSFGGFILQNETTGKIIAPQQEWDREFDKIEEAVIHAKSLPSIQSWEEEVEAAGIPLHGVSGAAIVKRYSLFVVVGRETKWGRDPIQGQAKYINDYGYRNVRGAILFFWQWVEETAKAVKNPPMLVDCHNDLTNEGQEWVKHIERSENPSLLFPKWCIEGQAPNHFWHWVEWFWSKK